MNSATFYIKMIHTSAIASKFISNRNDYVMFILNKYLLLVIHFLGMEMEVDETKRNNQSNRFVFHSLCLHVCV